MGCRHDARRYIPQMAQPGKSALALAAAAFLITALMALWPVTNSYGTDCGMWIENNTSKAAYEDAKYKSAHYEAYLGKDRTAEVDGCTSERNSRTPLLIVTGIATLALLTVGLIRRYQPSGGRAEARPPTD